MRGKVIRNSRTVELSVPGTVFVFFLYVFFAFLAPHSLSCKFNEAEEDFLAFTGVKATFLFWPPTTTAAAAVSWNDDWKAEKRKGTSQCLPVSINLGNIDFSFQNKFCHWIHVRKKKLERCSKTKSYRSSLLYLSHLSLCYWRDRTFFQKYPYALQFSW